MGKKVEWIDIDFKGLIPALQAGRADIAVSAIYITPERSRVVDFTDPYYAGGLVVLTKKDGPIKTLKDMDGRKVSVQVGTKSVNYLKEHFRRGAARRSGKEPGNVQPGADRPRRGRRDGQARRQAVRAKARRT